MRRIELIRDILDRQLIDRRGTRMGRVDGLVLRVEEGKPPRVDRFQLGFVVLARRIHPLAERIVNAMRRRFKVRPEAVQEVPWDIVGEITPDHIKIDIDAYDTPAFAWERWLRDRVVTHLPGSGEK
jgi:hypothetical protein